MELGSEIAAAGDANAEDPHDIVLLDGSLVNSSSETLLAATPAERDEASSTEPVLLAEPSLEIPPEEVRNPSFANVAEASLPNGGIEAKRRPGEHHLSDNGMADRLGILDSRGAIRECKSETEEADQMPSWMTVPSVPELVENTENLVTSRNVPDMTTTSLRRRSFFMIRMPRTDDTELKSKIRHAELQLEEASKTRDVVRAALQLRRASKIGLLDKLKVVRDKERACKDEFQRKRLEIDPLQSALNKLKFADTKYKGEGIFSEEDLDNRIASLQHRIQHESIPLKEEKQLIREIKLLDSQRSEVCANDAAHAHLMENYGSKEDIQNQLEIHYSELDVLRTNQNHARLECKPIEKDLEVLNVKIDELVDQMEVAKRSHSTALAACKELKKNLNEQNAGFYKYRDSLRKAKELASIKDLEGLSVLCNEQVESILSSWNGVSSFRERYMKNNMQSTLRRLETLDGRSLGVDEEPLLLVNDAEVAVEIQQKDVKSLPKRMPALKEPGVKSSNHSLQGNNTRVSEEEKDRQKPREILQGTSRSISQKEVMEGNRSGRMKSSKTSSKGSSPPIFSSPFESAAPAPDSTEDAAVKEAQAAKLKEKQRQEQIAKAKEAAERKRRQAERAQAKAQLREQKEAERREKERAKKAKRKAAFSMENAETLETSEISPIENKGGKELPETSVTQPPPSGKGKQLSSQRQPVLRPRLIEVWQNQFRWLLALFFIIVIGLASFLAGRFWT